MTRFTLLGAGLMMLVVGVLHLVAPQMIVYAARAPAWDRMDPALPAFATMPPAGPPSMPE